MVPFSLLATLTKEEKCFVMGSAPGQVKTHVEQCLIVSLERRGEPVEIVLATSHQVLLSQHSEIEWIEQKRTMDHSLRLGSPSQTAKQRGLQRKSFQVLRVGLQTLLNLFERKIQIISTCAD